ERADLVVGSPAAPALVLLRCIGEVLASKLAIGHRAAPLHAVADSTQTRGRRFMADRREFLQASAAGLLFVGCGLGHGAHAQAQPAGRRREVVLNGRRPRIIDVHAHCAIPAALAAAGEANVAKISPTTTRYPGLQQVADERLRVMDAQGIDMQALSINPIWYGWERDVVEKVVDIQNEALASFTAAHPDRFVAFASVALQFPDLAVTQLERAIKRQNLRGVAIGGSVAGVD